MPGLRAALDYAGGLPPEFGTTAALGNTPRTASTRRSANRCSPTTRCRCPVIGPPGCQPQLSPMGVIDDYWARSSGALAATFERTRASQKDPSVKGTANEQTLADFLRENTGVPRVALRSSIIDGDGRRSDEVDVTVVNENQPLWTGDDGQLLIAEGVDAVYQVKARLTSDELRRAIKNGQSVKDLFRPLGDGSIATATEIDGTRFIDHIPFFIFAYESALSLGSALKILGSDLAGSRWEAQPDGVFVLNSWSAVNVADNQGALKIGPLDVVGFHGVNSGSSLATMLWCHHLFVHRIVHFRHPLQRYHPFVNMRR